MSQEPMTLHPLALGSVIETALSSYFIFYAIFLLAKNITSRVITFSTTVTSEGGHFLTLKLEIHHMSIQVHHKPLGQLPQYQLVL